MSIGLMESARGRERDGRGMAASVAVHAVVIALAWYATAGASTLAGKPTDVITIPTDAWPKTPSTPAKRTMSHHGTGSSSRPPSPTIPFDGLHVNAGPIPVEELPVQWADLVAGPADIHGGTGSGAPSGAEPGTNGVFTTVDVMAEADPRNPAPVYPAMLRDAGVEGSVSAQFVVDTTGRVVAPTITFADGDNALFQRSVRRALEAARFRPALVAGRAVRVLMAQSFQFRLER